MDVPDGNRLRTVLLGKFRRRKGETGASTETQQVIDTFRAIETIQDEAGEPAACTYIVSMTRSSDDLLRVLVLAREAGLVDLSGKKPRSRLDVVPLFETLVDLDHAPLVMGALLDDPVYARQLEARGTVPLAAVFPGHGRVPSEQDELRRLQREVQRLQQENAFLKSAAAYFARESR